MRPTVFRGFDGNFRSKTIDGIGVGLGRTVWLTDFLSARYGAGIEIADWRDEHQLLTRDGRELVAGVEGGLSLRGAARLKIAPHLAFETTLEKVYWYALDLGELRWGFGLALTR
jgi:hypothetical protein